jgi:cytochrome P450
LRTRIDAASYYVIIATAGHDTTSSTISGGLHALIEHPDQLTRLRGGPGLVPLAVEEMIRWVTPVKEFMRTATAGTELSGTAIAQGEAVLLSYPSANRDGDVFADPFHFDAGRDPNKHLAFGSGVHYCLGAALARMETRAFYAELLPRWRTQAPAHHLHTDLTQPAVYGRRPSTSTLSGFRDHASSARRIFRRHRHERSHPPRQRPAGRAAQSRRPARPPGAGWS